MIRARPADVIDLFVYVVVLNLAIEYVPSVISESFTLSLLTAALLKIALELVILLKSQILTRLRAADTRRAKLAAAVSLWVVAVGSKLVVLELVDLVFGDARQPRRLHPGDVARRGPPRITGRSPAPALWHRDHGVTATRSGQQVRPVALLLVARRWSSVRDRSACQRLGRPAGASRDEVEDRPEGHVAAQHREVRVVHAGGREEADACEGRKTPADEHRRLASPAEREHELDRAGDHRPSTERDQRGAGVGAQGGRAHDYRGKRADRGVDALRCRVGSALRVGQRRDDVDQRVGREQRRRGEWELGVGGGHAIADGDHDRCRPDEGEHGARDEDALR